MARRTETEKLAETMTEGGRYRPTSGKSTERKEQKEGIEPLPQNVKRNKTRAGRKLNSSALLSGSQLQVQVNKVSTALVLTLCSLRAFLTRMVPSLCKKSACSAVLSRYPTFLSGYSTTHPITWSLLPLQRHFL